MDETLGFKMEFLAEAREHIKNFEEDIICIEGQGQDFDLDTINHLFRAIHSIKGSSSFLEYTRITELSHSLENVIDQVRHKKLILNESIIEALLKGIDKLKILLDNVDHQESCSIIQEMHSLKQLISSPMIEHGSGMELKTEGGTGALSARSELKEISIAGKLIGGTISKKLPVNTENIYRISVDLFFECANGKRHLSDLLEEIYLLGNISNVSLEQSPLEELMMEKNPSLKFIFTISTVIDDPDLLVSGLDITALAIKNITDVEASDEMLGGAVLIDTASEKWYGDNSRLEKESPKGIEMAEDRVFSMLPALPENPKEQMDLMPSQSLVQKPMESPKLLLGTPYKISGSESIQTFKKTGESSIRISLSLLDKLMNLAGELVLVRNQNLQSVDTGDLLQIRKISKKLNLITSDLQAAVMQTRMQSLELIFSRFKRMVRDIGKKMGKEVNLEISGNDVELDRNIVETLADPLTHLVRNALDHGIELPEERVKNNKSYQGKILLSARHEAGQVIINISDDGKGMDAQLLKKIAVQKGLISESRAKQMNEKEAFELVFEPGFSTASQVTDISGRGVGMDVVKTNIRKIGGTIDIVSKVGQGTVISLGLPLTLTIIPTLIIMEKEFYFAVPQYNIKEVVWLYDLEIAKSIKKVNDEEVFLLRDKLIPLARLSNLLNLKSEVEQDPESRPRSKRAGRSRINFSPGMELYILIIKVGNREFGLVVEDIIDTEEIVVKPLHEQLKKCWAYSGTAVLGDGKLALILDVSNLLKMGSFMEINQPMQLEKATGIRADQQAAILFKINRNENFAIPLFLISRIEKINKTAIQISQNKEYYTYQKNFIPIVRLEKALDSLQGEYDDDLYVIVIKSAKPVGILAREIIDNINISGDFETKDELEEGVIGRVMSESKLVTILDVYKLIEKMEPDWFLKIRENAPLIKKILLLEDTRFYASLIISYLKGAGVEVFLAHDGKEGIQAMTRERFDFIISDIEMPNMDGFEFARYVRTHNEYRNIPLLALSGAWEEKKGKQLAMEAGFDNYVSKQNQEAMLDILKKISISKS